MSVLRPPLVWINGICYRKQEAERGEIVYDKDTFGDTVDDYDDDELDIPQQRDDDAWGLLDKDLIDRSIHQLENGRFETSYHVATAFFAIIIGKKGATKKRIEMETRTKIVIPRMGEEGDIRIAGDTKHAIVDAIMRIHIIVESSRMRQDFTHFISIPLTVQEMKSSFIEFRDKVLDECRYDRGVEKNIFQDPNCLHLTICTLALMDNHERQKATDLLETCKEEIILPLVANNPLLIAISGLEIMNDDPAEVDVVYGKVVSAQSSQPCNILQTICDRIAERFVASGLATRQHERVKLHATLINTKYRQGDGGRSTMDAQKILKNYGEFHFCQMTVGEMHLSLRRTSRRPKDGYYSPSSIIKF